MNHEAPHYAIFYRLLLFPPPYTPAIHQHLQPITLEAFHSMHFFINYVFNTRTNRTYTIKYM